MVKQSCLVLVKPDGLYKNLTGTILNDLSIANLEIIGAKLITVPRELAEEHYSELKTKKPEIFEEVLKYIMGEYHTKKVLALVYSGEDAINKIRNIAGATHPEKAEPSTIRGKYGRINSQTDVLENCIHASDSEENAEKEIKLWFSPSEIIEEIFPTKTEKREIELNSWE